MPAIARRNLFHDKVKLIMALVGIVFSVALVTLQLGLLIGAMRNASGIIDHAGADVWVMQKSTRNLDLCDVMLDRRYYQAVATPGVAWGERLIVQFTRWKLVDGRQENVEIVGLYPNSRLSLPWEMVAGNRDRIWAMNGVIIDERERVRFGNEGLPLSLNEQTEILGRAARVVGFCRGVGSFTTSPYVFCDYKRGLDFSGMTQRQTKYVVLKARPGVSPEELRDRVRERLTEAEAYTADEFSRKTRWYWMYGTGMGIGIMFGAVLGVIVGVVIVSQTMYSATVERLREYGTLKALGMGNFTLGMIILRQSLIAGLLGYVMASALSYYMGTCLPAYNVPLHVPPALVGAMFFVTVGICVSASITSVLRVFRLEPAMVFRS
ncbi:MAG TPA: ABC transporter permease [Phycisphaerae bacterium]|nr:ABC transporter permease [Phycisphaerae bacterium]HRY69482.1 ABC transporter permease [Phycisphaerae bacterium]HSA29104.1 ABC transporter permease [Phycisphaerae bacterium]